LQKQVVFFKKKLNQGVVTPLKKLDRAPLMICTSAQYNLCTNVHVVREALSNFFFYEIPVPHALALNTISSQLLLNPMGDFDETWYKERSHCVDVHIVRRARLIIFQRVVAPGLHFL
jgi:hypothetical protein